MLFYFFKIERIGRLFKKRKQNLFFII